MSEDSMLMCLIAFVLGYLVSRMMRGNGLSVGATPQNFVEESKCLFKPTPECTEREPCLYHLPNPGCRPNRTCNKFTRKCSD